MLDASGGAGTSDAAVGVPAHDANAAASSDVVSVCLTTTAEADDRRAKQQTGFD